MPTTAPSCPSAPRWSPSPTRPATPGRRRSPPGSGGGGGRPPRPAGRCSSATAWPPARPSDAGGSRVDPHGTVRPEAGPPGEAVKPVRHGGLEIGRAAEARFADATPDALPRAKPPVRRLAKQLGRRPRAVRPTGPDGVVTRDDVEAAAALSHPHPRPAQGPLLASIEAGRPSGPRGAREDVRGSHPAHGRGHGATAPSPSRTSPSGSRSTSAAASSCSTVCARRPRSVTSASLRCCWWRAPRSSATAAAPAAQRRVRRPRRSRSCTEAASTSGIAAATPRGLVVPSVKDADLLSLPELAEALAELTRDRQGGPVDAGRPGRWDVHASPTSASSASTAARRSSTRASPRSWPSGRGDRSPWVDRGPARRPHGRARSRCRSTTGSSTAPPVPVSWSTWRRCWSSPRPTWPGDDARRLTARSGAACTMGA